MTASDRIEVVPNVLIWARESAGLGLAQAAKRLSVSEASLARWERGELPPTIKQLRRAAKLYKRPLAVLLLPVPATEFDALRDFRVTGGDVSRPWSPSLHAEYKRAISQRAVFLELLELSPASLNRVVQQLTLDLAVEPETAALAVRQALGMDDWSKGLWSKPNELLSTSLAAVEQLGVLVIQTQNVSISEMRGFSISEWPYPLIALNGSDRPRPRLFTLLHELCHVALNSGGLCDLREAAPRQRDSADNLEYYCNHVAASVLMPREMVLADPVVRAADQRYPWSLNELADLSRRYGASSEAMLIRLINLDKASWELYKMRKPELEREYEEAARRLRERQRESAGGPSYYVVKARDLGHGYVVSVLDAYRSRAISSLDVADYLDVRFDQLPRLEAAVL